MEGRRFTGSAVYGTWYGAYVEEGPACWVAVLRLGTFGCGTSRRVAADSFADAYAQVQRFCHACRAWQWE